MTKLRVNYKAKDSKGNEVAVGPVEIRVNEEQVAFVRPADEHDEDIYSLAKTVVSMANGQTFFLSTSYERVLRDYPWMNR